MMYSPTFDLELQAELKAQEEKKAPFLVLDRGLLATSFYMPAMLGIAPAKEYGENSFLKALMVFGSATPQIVCFVKNISRVLLKLILETQTVCLLEEDNTDGGVITKLFYNVPDSLREDYDLFSSGKFSKISLASRERIISISGLKYKVPSGSKFIYDKKLLVLEKSPLLRKYLEDILDVTIVEDAELLEIPGFDNYYIKAEIN